MTNLSQKKRSVLAAVISGALLAGSVSVPFASGTELSTDTLSEVTTTGTDSYDEQESVSSDQVPGIDVFLQGGGNGLLADSPDDAAPEEGFKEDACYFYDTFESGAGTWTGRGGASVDVSDGLVYKGSKALKCSGRTDDWNGAAMELSTDTFVPGTEYSFSVCAGTDTGTTTHFLLSLQYDSGSETIYDHLAEADCVKGKYVQLANPNYKIPSGATNMTLYIETKSSSGDFYIDEAIAAPAGTAISGPQPYKFILGDINADMSLDTFDLAASRKFLVSDGFSDKQKKKAADVDQNGEFAVADTVLLSEFLLGKITEFPVAEKIKPEAKSMEEFTAEIAPNVVNMEPNSSKDKKGGVDYGKIEQGTYHSDFANKDKPYYILLPAGYDGTKEYPVMYVMHGYYEKVDRMIINGNQTGSMRTQQIVGNAIADGEAEEMILVFPYVFTSKRLNECTGMDNENNQAYDDFEHDLLDSLMPYIEEHYSVKTGRENTAITGFSMGGRESLLIGLKHPDLFGYVGAICPAPGVPDSIFVRHTDEESPYLLFLSGGTNDDVVGTIPVGYHNSLEKNGVPHVWHYIQGGYHGDNSIHSHLYNFVRAVFKAA
jgi:enterochelin esterase-like enzyme